MNIKLFVSYDGTEHLGWQPGIDRIMREVLEKLLQHPIYLQAASRTDAGVHAIGQVVNFITHHDLNDLSRLQYSANSLLPKSIRILSIQHAADDFHPSLDCLWKEYCYHVYTGAIMPPLQRMTQWHYPYSLDLHLMNQLASHLCGVHDFAAFCNRQNGEIPENTVRELFSIEIEKQDDQLRFIVKGQNFLYKMVRNLVGTLLQVGSGVIPHQQVVAAFEKKDRTTIGITAPAHGLVLNKVHYTTHHTFPNKEKKIDLA